MKHMFLRKAIAIGLSVMMLVSIFAMTFSVSADNDDVEITPNTDFVYNGITYRFDVREGNTDSYARILADGSIEFKYSYGDILWFPDVKMTDTSALHAEVTALAHDSDSTGMGNVFMGIVYGATEKADGSFEKGVGGILRTAGRARITEFTRENISNHSGGDYGDGGASTKIYNPGSDNFKDHPNYACVKSTNNDWGFNKTITFDVSRADANVTFAMSSADGEFFSHTYNNGSNPYAGAVGFTSIWANNNGYKTFRFDKLTLTDCTVNGEAKDSYTVLERQPRPMELLSSSIEFDGGYAFVEFGFTVTEDYADTAVVVVKKNSIEVARKAVSELTAVEGKYSESIHFAYGDGSLTTDMLTFSLEDNGEVVALTTATVMIGELYDHFLNSPVTVPNSDYLTYKIYAEDFSESMKLEPGVNIVNGHKWTYIKNSEDGSAEIKNGRLYFTGSKNDMLLFDDVMLDKAPYMFTYDVTYLDTPSDDIWDEWDCWFGGLFHLANEADADGNRNAIIASITPDSIHMMSGKFNGNGEFAETEADSWHYSKFENTSGTYWNGRLGNGLPATVYNYLGVNSTDNGGLYLSGYNGDKHQAAANLPGSGPLTNDRRVGRVGFVCSDSKVNVIVDNIEIMTKGKTIVVDGAEMQIAGDGKVDVSALQADDLKLVYANVDGSLKYAGDVITANRLTTISTVQIALSTNKAAADGQTGLKWTTQISKADYEKLTSDSNISKVEVGTVVVATANAKDGVNKTVATSDISGTAVANGDNYVFEGVLPIGKDARDTSYSGVGYIKVTMKSGKEVVVYADYIARLHAFALSEFVENFVDDGPVDPDNGNDSTGTVETNDVTADNGAVEKKGCGSSVAGAGIVLVMMLTAAGMMFTKKSEKDSI